MILFHYCEVGESMSNPRLLVISLLYFIYLGFELFIIMELGVHDNNAGENAAVKKYIFILPFSLFYLSV